MGWLGIRPLWRILIDLTLMTIEDACVRRRDTEKQHQSLRGRTIWVVMGETGSVYAIHDRPEDAQAAVRRLQESDLPSAYCKPMEIE